MTEVRLAVEAPTEQNRTGGGSVAEGMESGRECVIGHVWVVGGAGCVGRVGERGAGVRGCDGWWWWEGRKGVYHGGMYVWVDA